MPKIAISASSLSINSAVSIDTIGIYFLTKSILRQLYLRRV
jgi:hypothetical protein